jgi:hypothetical protein
MRKKPVVVYVGTGLSYVVFIIWSVRSLQRFGYEPIEIIVGTEREKRLVNEKLPDVQCETVSASRNGYHIWMWKPFVLERYELKHPGRDVVLSDGDVLWKQDPSSLFERFSGQFWFHKLHQMDPAELEQPVEAIRPGRLDLRAFAYYHQRYGFTKPQTFMLSGGLFMVPYPVYNELIVRWVAAIRRLPPSEALMNQVILSIVANEMGLEPVRDREAGYAVARHYLSAQKHLFIEAIRESGLDWDNLNRLVRRDTILTTPSRAYARLRKWSKLLEKARWRLRKTLES